MSGKNHILVIDDEASIRRSFERALKDTDYSLTTANSGEQGLLALQNKPYQLVFLGLNLQGIGGVATLQKIRELSMTLPVYIVTAFHRESLIELDEARKMGLPFQLLRKPIGSVEIVALAQSVLDKPARLSSGVSAL
ncbi:MAG: response regulator [Gammaproteobacteria bacterium]|nr:response regulator [Gammaproteobacteria bacterium]